jgi:hypothetical protein
MRKKLGISLAACALVALVALAIAAIAAAGSGLTLTLRAGNLLIHAEGGFSPTTLPRHEDAPITIHGGGAISTINGDLPPIVKTITIEFDRHGAVDTTGLEVCPSGRLQATTTAQARQSCPNAIVGIGAGTATIAFPEQRPINLTTPLILFNGPRKHGGPTIFAHAYLSSPVSASFVVPITIERIHKGAYGYRTEAKIPVIAGGAGIPISGHLKIGREWTYRGVKHSYVKARCETGHLQARTEFTFKDGTFLSGVFIPTCQPRG